MIKQKENDDDAWECVCEVRWNALVMEKGGGGVVVYWRLP